MSRPAIDWQRLLTADVDPAGLGVALRGVRLVALAAAVVLPSLFWALDWRLVSFWLAEAVCLAALAVDRRAQPAWRNALLRPGLVYAAVIAASAFASRYPVLAWHGAFDRQEGAFTLFGYVALALLPPLALRGWQAARRLVWVVLALAAAQGTFALLQYFGAVPPFILSRLPAWYQQALFAQGLFNSTTLAASVFGLALVTAACLYAAGGSRWCLAAVALLNAALLATLSRGAWLGTALALLVGLLLLRRHGPLHRRRLAALALTGVAVTAAMALASPVLAARISGIPADAIGAWRCAVGLGCPADTALSIPVEPDYNSMTQRLVLYRLAGQALRARPWLGWGPDSFEIAWNTLRDRTTLYSFGLLARVDKAHSDLLQVGVATGFLGLAAYLWLLLAGARAAWRGGRVAGAEGAERVAVAAGALAYWLAAQVTITHVSSAPSFWLFLGLLAVALPGPDGPTGRSLATHPTTHQAR